MKTRRFVSAWSFLLALVLSFSLVGFSGCAEQIDYGQQQSQEQPKDSSVQTATDGELYLEAIPEYSGEPYIEVDNNEPTFSEEEKESSPFESYSPLDYEGRCGTAFALVGHETMPTEERESISSVHPSGWQSVSYDFIEGKSLYNRCHLLGFQLTGENANEENLITGTRYLNTEGMLPFEDEIDDYVDETNNHVLYRVTPLYYEDELVARGVHMEAYSVEDNGEGVSFNIYCYNVQPGVDIDYQTGDNDEDDRASYIRQGVSPSEVYRNNASNASVSTQDETSAHQAIQEEQERDYILNTRSMRFHEPSCPSVEDMSSRNKKEFSGLRSDLIDQGYQPCNQCNP